MCVALKQMEIKRSLSVAWSFSELASFTLTLSWTGLRICCLAWHDTGQGLWLHPGGNPLSAAESTCLGIQSHDGKADLSSPSG